VKHSIEWLDDAENAAPEERSTVADLRLEIAGVNVTQHLYEDVLRDHITVALYGLAHGIVHDWWRIFGSRDRETTFLSYRSGYLLPDIRIRFDGAVFEIEARQHTYRNPDVRFWGGISEVMSRRDGEAILTELVANILNRLSYRGCDETGAAIRWRRVQASRNSTEATFCEAAGGLGLDPYNIADEAANFIEDAEKIFERDALVEFVSGSAGVRQSQLLSWVHAMRTHRGFRYRLADLRDAITEVTRSVPPKDGEQAWALGYRRARRMRQTLKLTQSHRFTSFQNIAELFGAAKSYNLAPRVEGIRALRSEREDGLQIHLRNHGDSAEAQASHLFAMARAVGDAACFPVEPVTAINDLHLAYRQAAGRAFAAEFLAPVDEIESMINDKHDIATISDSFSVSTSVIERQLENRERITAACAA
jgi:hypothetical protein